MADQEFTPESNNYVAQADADAADSFRMTMNTSMQKGLFGEINSHESPTTRLNRQKMSQSAGNRKKQGIDGLQKLKLLKQKNELFNHMKKQGLISMGSGLTKILDESYLKTWETFHMEGIDGLQVQYNARCNEDDQTRAFVVALLRNFFLELSVDKIELMCQGYVDQIMLGQVGSNQNSVQSESQIPQSQPEQQLVMKNQPEYEPSQGSTPRRVLNLDLEEDQKQYTVKKVNPDIPQIDTCDNDLQTVKRKNRTERKASRQVNQDNQKYLQEVVSKSPPQKLSQERKSNASQKVETRKRVPWRKMSKSSARNEASSPSFLTRNFPKQYQTIVVDSDEKRDLKVSQTLKNLDYTRKNNKSGQRQIPKLDSFEEIYNDQRFLESINQKFNTQRLDREGQPAYMSPTMAYKRKQDYKKTNGIDLADNCFDIQQILRTGSISPFAGKSKLESGSIMQNISPSRMAWKPNGVTKKQFDKVKSPTFKTIQKKSISTLKYNSSKQQQLFTRLYGESFVKQKTKIMYDKERELREIQKCTFMPNHSKYQTVRGIKPINPFFNEENESNNYENKKQIEDNKLSKNSQTVKRKSKGKNLIDVNLSSLQSDFKASNNSQIISRAMSTANIRGTASKKRGSKTGKKHNFKNLFKTNRTQKNDPFSKKSGSVNINLLNNEIEEENIVDHDQIQIGSQISPVQVHTFRQQEEPKLEQVSNNVKSCKTPKNGGSGSFLNQPIEPEEKSDNTSANMLRPRKDLFNYLSTEGQKNDKLAEYEYIKQQQEIEGCTFKPTIINDYKSPSKAEKVENQKLPIHEKLNLIAKEKDEKIQKTYEQTKKWRELKDCTFQPKINKDNTFKNKRKSNSVQGLRNEVPQMDPYYQKLNEIFGKKNFDQQMSQQNLKDYNNIPSVLSEEIQDSMKRSSVSPDRYEMLYNTQKAYDAKKELLKKEVSDEQKKAYTYKPQLYRSKVKPNQALNYQIYQKRSNLPKDLQEQERRKAPSLTKNPKYKNHPMINTEDSLDKFMKPSRTPNNRDKKKYQQQESNNSHPMTPEFEDSRHQSWKEAEKNAMAEIQEFEAKKDGKSKDRQAVARSKDILAQHSLNSLSARDSQFISQELPSYSEQLPETPRKSFAVVEEDLDNNPQTFRSTPNTKTRKTREERLKAKEPIQEQN